MKYIHPNIIRQVFVLLLILLIGGLIFWEIVPYLSGILGAITIYVIFRKWMVQLVKKGWNPNLAATLIMLLSFIGILIPVSGLIAMLGSKMGKAVEKSESVIEIIKDQLFVVEKTVDYAHSLLVSDENLKRRFRCKMESKVTFLWGGTFYFSIYSNFVNDFEESRKSSEALY